MINIIIDIICDGEILKFEELQNKKTRKREIVFAKQLIMYFAYEFKVCSNTTSAALFNMDRASVNHAVKTINNLIDTDSIINNRVTRYHKIIRNRIDTNEYVIDLAKQIEPIDYQICILEQKLIQLRSKYTELTFVIEDIKNNSKLKENEK